MAKFQEELKAISKKIHTRNSKLEVPYTYLLPENVPNSIDIWNSANLDCQTFSDGFRIF